MADLLERAERAARRKRSTKNASASGDRWARMNRFVDLHMRNLKPQEQSVWFYLFRYERGGTTEATVRQIARGVNLHRNVAHRALTQLIEVGLVEVVKLSKSHKAGSIFKLPTVTCEVTVPSPVGGFDRHL